MPESLGPTPFAVKVSLRHDNADRRLSLESDADALGLIRSEGRVATAAARWGAVGAAMEALQETRLSPHKWAETGVDSGRPSQK